MASIIEEEEGADHGDVAALGALRQRQAGYAWADVAARRRGCARQGAHDVPPAAAGVRHRAVRRVRRRGWAGRRWSTSPASSRRHPAGRPSFNTSRPVRLLRRRRLRALCRSLTIYCTNVVSSNRTGGGDPGAEAVLRQQGRPDQR
jgi:hypothetical protein